MTQYSEIYFEIFDGGDMIRVEPYQGIKYDSALDWDRNWIKTKVTIKGGVFSGQYVADFMTTDFELLKRDFKKLERDFNATANFEPLEEQLKLNISGDGLGHFEVKCIAQDQPGVGGTLSFVLSFDQTEIARLIDELDKITKAFPISGDMTLKNE
ncbi:MAG: WapI family immunity protein [Ginsengibacter sp.]